MEAPLIRPEYDFDDVLIVPNYRGFSQVNSRTEVSTFAYMGDYAFPVPIIAAPMKGIISTDLIIALAQAGGIGIMHRFMEQGQFISEYAKLYQAQVPFGVAIGLKSDPYQLESALDFGAKLICVDIANGYIDSLAGFCASIAETVHRYGAFLMAGNVVTYGGVYNLWEVGVDMVRVGIGGGNLCTTRNVTGVGRPQISTLLECSQAEGIIIVADAGIRNSGDMVKAFTAGADFVMIGSLFGTTYESANNGILYGGASARLQEEYYYGQKPKTIEGIEQKLEPYQSLEELLFDPATGLIPGVQSACTYLNSPNISDLRHNAKFVGAGKHSIKDLSKFEGIKKE